MTRSDFLKLSAALVGGVLFAEGCGDGDGGGGYGGTPTREAEPTSADGCGATIGTNHGHALTVTRADVDAGADKTYDIRGSGDHPHTVEVSAADFERLAAGESVQLTSSSVDGHTHAVTIRCA